MAPLIFEQVCESNALQVVEQRMRRHGEQDGTGGALSDAYRDEQADVQDARDIGGLIAFYEIG